MGHICVFCTVRLDIPADVKKKYRLVSQCPKMDLNNKITTLGKDYHGAYPIGSKLAEIEIPHLSSFFML